jgi:HrpA-like RNA helicase
MDTTTKTYQKQNYEKQTYEVKSTEEALKDLDYPVVQEKKEIMEVAMEHPSFVLVGETGSGKTTCLPIMLLEMKEKLGLESKIAVTQPRRVATRSVANRVSDLVGCKVGREVGYQVRFEDRTSEGTDINFMTDGILLRKLQSDPLLHEYSIVMVDEAHERSLNIDLCLGLLRDANDRRAEAGMEPLRIAVTSATIEREKFAKYFGNGESGNSMEVQGRMFPVQVYYEEPLTRDFMQAAAVKVKQIVESEDTGDILVFMPGKEEIDRTIEGIENLIDTTSVEIIRLHADVSPEEQDRIFIPNGKRKIIVSTNIAETSITVPSVTNVVDSGYIKQIEFDPETGIEQLVLRPHAISGLDQRAGRAGRVGPGKCYRLFSEDSLEERQQYQTPEIQRSELSHVVLVMKKFGIDNVEEFKFIDPLDISSVHQAIETLKTLGALDEQGNLTETGNLMAELGLEPKLGRMVIEAEKYDCVEDVCTVAAFFGGKRLFNRPKGKEREADIAHGQFKDSRSDFITCLNVWDAYVFNGYKSQWARENFLNSKGLEEAKKVRYELLRVLRRNGVVVDGKRGYSVYDHDIEAVGKAVTAGLIGNLMEHYRGYSFIKTDGTEKGIYIHPSSAVFKNTNIYSLIVSSDIFKNDRGKIYANNCQIIRPEWIPEIAPQLIQRKTEPYGAYYDVETDSVVEDIRLNLKGSYNGIVVGNLKEPVEEVEKAVTVFAGALARGDVPVPDDLVKILEKNEEEVKRLNNLWVRAGGDIEE